MSTNYYLQLPDGPACPHCGHSERGERLHIGKSSQGWCFALHVMPERGIHDLCDWLKLFVGANIRDQYGVQIEPQLMLDRIISGDMRWRRRELGRSCVKHGAGPWDCVEGEFS